MVAKAYKVAGTKGMRIRASASHDSTGINQRPCRFCGLSACALPRDDSFDPEKAPVLSSTRPSKPKVSPRFSKSLLCPVVERTSPVAPQSSRMLLVAAYSNTVGLASGRRERSGTQVNHLQSVHEVTRKPPALTQAGSSSAFIFAQKLLMQQNDFWSDLLSVVSLFPLVFLFLMMVLRRDHLPRS